jgi:hypothetical protein
MTDWNIFPNENDTQQLCVKIMVQTPRHPLGRGGLIINVRISMTTC